MGVKPTREWKRTGVKNAVSILCYITEKPLHGSQTLGSTVWDTTFHNIEIWLRKTLGFILVN